VSAATPAGRACEGRWEGGGAGWGCWGGRARGGRALAQLGRRRAPLSSGGRPPPPLPPVLRPLTLSVCCAPSLYSRGIIMGYKGAKNSQINHTSLLKIEGVNTPDDTQFYLGKVCASFACLLRPAPSADVDGVAWALTCRSLRRFCCCSALRTCTLPRPRRRRCGARRRRCAAGLGCCLRPAASLKSRCGQCGRANRGCLLRAQTRVIWGRVMKKHGNSGVVKAKFRTNLVRAEHRAAWFSGCALYLAIR
jgi:ribosomal protein L35AE/L33A